MGSLHFLVFDRGTFWVLPLTDFCTVKSARAYLFLQSVKMNYFCSGPISVDPICPQPKVSALTEMTLIPKEAKYVINAFLQQDSGGFTCLTSRLIQALFESDE